MNDMNRLNYIKKDLEQVNNEIIYIQKYDIEQKKLELEKRIKEIQQQQFISDVMYVMGIIFATVVLLVWYLL